MKMNILMMIFAILFFQVSSLTLTKHDGNFNTCFYLPIGEIQTTDSFNYTITTAWTAEQASQLKNGALNTSDFIDVQGWTPYNHRHPSQFFDLIGAKGRTIIEHQLTFVKDVLEGSDAPQFYLSTPDLQFAFGNPSQAKLYKVPSGKVLIAVRFQASVSSNPYIGKWSVLHELVDDDHLEFSLNVITARVSRLAKATHLTPLDVARSLNIIPPFIENSIFWTLSQSPPAGTVKPVSYQGFIVAIRAGQSILAGPIEDGQHRVIQVKDVVRDRSPCA